MAAKLRANSYLVMDFETSGLISSRKSDPEYDESKQGQANSKYYAITEFAGIVLKGDDLSEMVRYENLIKPYDDKLIYSQGAANITKITKEICETHGVELNQFMKDFVELCNIGNEITGRYQKVVLIGHNLGFDIPFLQEAAKRCNVDLSKLVDGHINFNNDFSPRYLDTERMSVNLWGDNENQRSFNLTSCCEKAGIDIVQAHRAMNDVIPTTDLFRYFTFRMRNGKQVESKSEENSLKQRKEFQLG